MQALEDGKMLLSRPNRARAPGRANTTWEHVELLFALFLLHAPNSAKILGLTTPDKLKLDKGSTWVEGGAHRPRGERMDAGWSAWIEGGAHGPRGERMGRGRSAWVEGGAHGCRMRARERGTAVSK